MPCEICQILDSHLVVDAKLLEPLSIYPRRDVIHDQSFVD